MREEEHQVTAEAHAGSSEMESHDWSQTPLGANETWSDDLKIAVQRRLTELAQAKPAAQQSTPRQWTETEVKLVEKTWAAVERARTEAALRESEERYRMLFESIDEGFCVVEVLFDAAGTPFDHRILQANPAFGRQTGIANPEGKVASELAPGLEQYWNDLYAQVIHTGESIRLENRSDALDRW